MILTLMFIKQEAIWSSFDYFGADGFTYTESTKC